MKSLATGKLRPTVIRVNGEKKRLPFFSGSRITSAEQAIGGHSSAAKLEGRAAGAPGVAINSLGCSNRNQGRNVRVNQDCTFRRQAEEHIAYNPTDPNNLVAGMNDSIIGWNQTSLDFSLDGGQHWGAISTAPFRYRLNAPEDLLPTAADPNRHTILGTPGTLHSYDACSDPWVGFDTKGRAFYTCVTFDIATWASMVFVVPSPPGAKGSYFDQVPAPFGLSAPQTGREHVVAEDNSPKASYDGPKLAVDSYQQSPNSDNVYSTFTVFDFTCGPNHDEYCRSPIYGSMSTDHGFTWSTPELLSGASDRLCVLGDVNNPSLNPHACNMNGHSDVAVMPNGDISVTFLNGNTPSVNQQILGLHCHPTGRSPAGTAHLNCGRPTKVATEVVRDAPGCDFGGGAEQCIPGAFIRAPVETSQRLAVDQSNGDLYVTWYDYRFGEFDVFLTRSTDGGRNWTRPRKVNPDHGTDHYFSAVDVNESGTGSKIGISYYRTARVPNENNAPEDGFEIGDPGVADRLSDYVLSGGNRPPFNFQVLSPKFPAPDGIQAGFNGDYTQLTITPDGKAHPIWSDTRVRVPNPGFNSVSVDEDVYTDSRRLPSARS